MKALLLLAFSYFYVGTALADTNILGTELGIMPNSTGKPAFGVQYTYGNDPDGKNYLVTFTPALSPSEKTKHFLWNFYIEGSGFLLPWDNKNDTQLAIVQLGVQDNSVITKILSNQSLKNGMNVLSLVFEDRNTKQPIYYLPISQLCADLPTHFVDLTNGKACDQITNP